jgi:hypothetical protein
MIAGQIYGSFSRCKIPAGFYGVRLATKRRTAAVCALFIKHQTHTTMPAYPPDGSAASSILFPDEG